MKKIIAILLALAMAFCICGCKGNGDNTSTLSDDVEYERIEVYYDENGNEITKPSSDKTSNNTSTNNSTVSNNNSTNTSGNANTNTNTSTNNQAAAIDYNTVVEVDICDDIIRGYLSATSVDQQYYFLNEYTGSQLDYQNLHLDWNLDGSSIYTVYISENLIFQTHILLKLNQLLLKKVYVFPAKLIIGRLWAQIHHAFSRREN